MKGGMDVSTAEQCFRKYLNGDESGLDYILECYHDTLILFINRYVQDLDTAEELAADSFAQLFLTPKKYNFSVSLKTYLFTIGKSRALDWLRVNRRKKTAELPEFIAVSTGPEQILIHDEEKQQLYAAINRLRGDYKTVIHLVYFEDLSYKEAAYVMKKSEKQIQNLVYRAKEALREDYRKEGLLK